MSKARPDARTQDGSDRKPVRRSLGSLWGRAADIFRAGDRCDAELHAKLDELRSKIETLEGLLGGMGLTGRVVHVERDVKAILRRLFLRTEGLPYPERLTAARFSGFSQNEEDGITLALLSEMGTRKGRFIEIGCGANGGNSGFFALELGWSGLMVDGDPAKVEIARRLFAGRPVSVRKEWISRETINDLLSAEGMTGEIEMLSIDIDGVDYWIWEAIDVCSPRLVIAEYNSLFGPDLAVTIPYSSDFNRKEAPSGYYGASLAALDHLARTKGYRLVAVEPRGVNAYFLRNDVSTEIPGCRVSTSFRSLEKLSRRRFNEELGSQDIVGFFEQKGYPLVEVARQAGNGPAPDSSPARGGS